MTGEAWETVLEGADRNCSRPRISNKDDRTNVYVLAAAIVYARTGQVEYKKKVVRACEKLVGRGRPRGRTLAWARGVGAYALAADLVGYRTPEFEAWLLAMAEGFEARDRRTLRQMFQERPNNWGAHAFGSLCAVYRYLGMFSSLEEIRKYWIQGVTGPNPGFKFGSDSTWHVDKHDPRWINPRGAVKDSLNIDGIIGDDLRRAGSLSKPPTFTNYAWEGLQGLVMAARILERARLPIWVVGDSALYRAAHALQVRFSNEFGPEWRARGDDQWLLPFIDAAYGTSWSHDQSHLWQHGKGAGWGYVILAETTPEQYRLFVTCLDSGEVSLDPPGGLYYEGTPVTLTAHPKNDWRFVEWRGDVASSKTSVTVLMDGDKYITATFVPDSLPGFRLTVKKKGRGSVRVQPDRDWFDDGTLVKLTAKPDPGYRFAAWDGDIKDFSAMTRVVMDSDKGVRAIFKKKRKDGRLHEAAPDSGVDEAGTPSLASEPASGPPLPASYQLFQNYPNPFNPETQIRFHLPQAGHVELRIFNMLGQEIRTLVDVHLEAGIYKVLWDGADKNGRPAATGLYFYRIHAADFSDLKKMNLLR
ncbi:MAG: FlgD immunoglobulin-like domain containing protein [bacterium]